MTQARLALGSAGEALAAEHLEAAGYRILVRRWHAAGREIDLVAERDGVIALVEVKTRGPGALASPLLAVDWRKQRQLAAAGAVAAARWKGPDRVFRFDVVSITWGPAGVVIDHLEDAFRP
ncbi:MAG: YraN family protein [Gemmatimonadota bacterium]